MRDLLKCLTGAAQQIIASQMPLIVIEELEAIQITHDERDGGTDMNRPLPFGLQMGIEAAAVG